MTTAPLLTPRPWWLALAVSAVVQTAAGQEALPPGPAATAPGLPAASTAAMPLLEDRPIGQLRATVKLPEGAQAPENTARPHLQAAGLEWQPTGLGRGFCLQPVDWEATALRHLPLYFEEPNLERLGYYYGYPCDGRYRRWICSPVTNYLACKPDDSWLKQKWFAWQYKLDCNPPHNQLIQPVVSACHFYGRIAALPYMMGAACPREEFYVLGEDRPGSPVPYRKHYIPLSLKGILYQGAAVTGLGYAIP
uniref:Uncharacterized protein n=1 Tax=Schlesneria paludicola TaxID=360056 RepID=A0A7C2NX98_9PLAN